MNKLQYKYTLFSTSFFPWFEDLWMSSERGLLWLHCSETDFIQQFQFWSSPILVLMHRVISGKEIKDVFWPS